MKRTRHSAEQIVSKLREADAMLAAGRGIAQVVQTLGVSEQTFHRERGTARAVRGIERATASGFADQCGLGYRIAQHYDTTRPGTVDTDLVDGTVDAADPWFIFTCNDRWQKLGGGTFRAVVTSGTNVRDWGGSLPTIDANPKELQIHHRAGRAGYGSSSYIDSMLLREKDTRDSSDAIQPPLRRGGLHPRSDPLLCAELESRRGGVAEH